MNLYFNIRFKMRDCLPVESDNKQEVVNLSGVKSITLKGDRETIRKSTQFSLIGGPHPSEEEAFEAGYKVRNHLILFSLTQPDVSIDFQENILGLTNKI